MATKQSDEARAARIQRTIEALQALVEVFEDRREALARTAGLSPTQWQVLEQVGRDDFMPSLFARRREVSAAAVSRTLRQLLDARLVDVQISPRDARQRLYRVTEKGRKALGEVHDERRRAVAAVWEALSDADLNRFEKQAGTRSRALSAVHAMLKDGGLVGVVQHRAGPKTDTSPEAFTGYVPEARVIELAANAGFVLEARSEINANPRDEANHPEGVWTLPPTLRLGDRDRAEYLAIGESDRMTLRFRKP